MNGIDAVTWIRKWRKLSVCWRCDEVVITIVLRTNKIHYRQSLAIAHHYCWDTAGQDNLLAADKRLLIDYQRLDTCNSGPFMFPLGGNHRIQAIHAVRVRWERSVPPTSSRRQRKRRLRRCSVKFSSPNPTWRKARGRSRSHFGNSVNCDAD